MRKIWIDIETSGVNLEKNFILQLSYIIEEDNKILLTNDLKMQKINFTDEDIDLKALEVNGINIEEIKTYPSIEAQIKVFIEDIYKFFTKDELYNYKKKPIICGYNVAFDISFLKKAFEELGLQFNHFFSFMHYDVMQVVNGLRLFGKINTENIKLATVLKFFNLLPEDGSKLHNSMVDILLTKKLDNEIMQRFNFSENKEIK